MERVKSKRMDDQLAATKAAAWAWYQRGSGSEGKPMSEFEARRTPRSPIPSRYKLEAIAATKAGAKPKLGLISPLTSPSQSVLEKSHLLDKYEIERISKQLDHYTVTGEQFLAGEGTNNKKVTIGGGGRKKGDKTKLSTSTTKGLWWLRPHGMVITCGTSRNDVVELTRVFRPEKPATVVGAGNMRPRRTHTTK